MLKMYILVRKDLPKNVQTVQACHAAAECAMYKNHRGWDNGTMVVLGVQNHSDLMHWASELNSLMKNGNHYEYALFQETDMPECPETALAIVLTDDQIPLFKDLRLL